MSQHESKPAGRPDDDVRDDPSLLDQIVAERQRIQDLVARTNTGGTPDQPASTGQAIETLIEMIRSGEIEWTDDIERMIERKVADLDREIEEQVNAIIHAPAFQEVERTWAGLNHLVTQLQTGPLLQVKVLDATKEELATDVNRTGRIERKAFYNLVYSQGLGRLGGRPYGVIVGDYQFSHSSRDVTTLSNLSTIAAAAHAPFVTAPSPQLFGLNDFRELGEIEDYDAVFAHERYAKWRSFRDAESSRYVGLVMPRMLLREPYSPDDNPGADFRFVERVGEPGAEPTPGTPDDRGFLFGNAAYAYAARLGNSFRKHGWCTAIRGIENGGKVEGLPHFMSRAGGREAQVCPIDYALDYAQEKRLADFGFISLVHHDNSDWAVFFSSQSAHKPQQYVDDRATANAHLGANLQHILATSRFTHYINVIATHKVGSDDFSSREALQTFLNNWIIDYVDPNPTPGSADLHKKPLRDAGVEVRDNPARPGFFETTIWLRPHFQLEELSVSMRLVAEVPKQG